MNPAGRHSARTGTPRSLGDIQKALHQQVVYARRRLTFSDLERQVARREACPRALVRTAIRCLIEQGILEYSYTFGQSYIVMSFRHPVHVSSLFTIVPPGYAGDLPPHRHPVAIAPVFLLEVAAIQQRVWRFRPLRRDGVILGRKVNRPLKRRLISVRDPAFWRLRRPVWGPKRSWRWMWMPVPDRKQA